MAKWLVPDFLLTRSYVGIRAEVSASQLKVLVPTAGCFGAGTHVSGTISASVWTRAHDHRADSPSLPRISDVPKKSLTFISSHKSREKNILDNILFFCLI